MSFSIEQQGDGLLVRIESSPQSGQQIFDAVCACRRESWWSCPSGECARIGAWDAQHEAGTTVITFMPRAGEALSAGGIEECLRYVLDESGLPA